MKQTHPKRRRCQGWINSDGIVARCPELYTPDRTNSRRFHSPSCVGRTNRLRKRGFTIGSPIREKQPLPKRCTGWVIRDGVIAKCGQLFVRKRKTATAHKRCREQKYYLSKREFSLGDAYRKGKVTKPQHQKACRGWVIRGSVIVECGQLFTPTKRDDLYHSTAEALRTAAWRRRGLVLGDSVRRKCAYRNCTNPPFDRVKRSTSGDYYCAGTSHGTLEKLARMADKVAQDRAELQRLRASGGAPHKTNKTKESTVARITLAALFLLEDRSPYAMKDDLFPKQHLPEQRYGNVKTLFRRYRPKIEAEKLRLAVLSSDQRSTAVKAARRLI